LKHEIENYENMHSLMFVKLKIMKLGLTRDMTLGLIGGGQTMTEGTTQRSGSVGTGEAVLAQVRWRAGAVAEKRHWRRGHRRKADRRKKGEEGKLGACFLNQLRTSTCFWLTFLTLGTSVERGPTFLTLRT
jgi:hypothetical protein